MQPFELDDSRPAFARARALREDFAKDAVIRDRDGGRPSAQIDLLRQSGLLTLLIPRDFGGGEEKWSTILRIVRELSKVDGSLGHLFGYHHLCVASLRSRTNPEQRDRLMRESARNNWFWGNTGDPISRSLLGERNADGYVLNGKRPFSSGSHVADRLQISWEHKDTGARTFAAIPADRRGVVIKNDWNGLGQRQTGSGTVEFVDAVVACDEVLDFSYRVGAPFKSIGASLSQNILLNVFIGSAQGALLAASTYTKGVSRPWRTSGLERHIDDPWIKRVYGDLFTKVSAATALADRALDSLDHVWARGEALTEAERGQNAMIAAAANVFAGEVALEVGNKIFEVMGARSATADQGFDRFWRNVRTHTLHNPVEYKTRNVGYWFLTGQFPEPDIYQ